MKEKKIYKCDYCNYKRMNKTQMKKHEKDCFYNPDNKTCWTCDNNSANVCLEKITSDCYRPVKNCEKYKQKEY